MSKLNIGVIVGSLSSNSINRKLANALIKLAPEGVSFTDISIGEVSLYSSDYDADYPPAGLDLKKAIEASDGILIVTPEYNRAMPGVLKNALDWASRPWGQNSFNAKPVAVIGASPGAIGTAVAQASLRPVLGFLNVAQLGQPEVYIQYSKGLVDDDANVTNESTEAFLKDYMKTVTDFVRSHKG